jgi:type II secretory pathway predicted ATPase ExeA
MYETAFGFRLRPFAAAPTAALYYPASNVEKARTSLARCIEHDGGPGLIVGPAGVGKSLLCQLVADQFKSRFRVVTLASARLCTRRALLQNILFELGLPYRDLEEGELRLSLIDYLANDERAAQGMLLVVDEAHSLPTRLLEEIRMITNLVRNGKPRVRLILAGSARLEERFASPKLESFNQRVAVRCYLESLGREETRQYVQSQIVAAGRKASDVFTPDALDAVFDATGGVPRLINQVCDHALVLATVNGQTTIRAAGIQEAWSDLQQLPAPWHLTADKTSTDKRESVIEFGTLDAEPTPPAVAMPVVAKPVVAPHTYAAPHSVRDPIAQLAEIEKSVAAANDLQMVWDTGASATDPSDDDEQFQPAGVIGPEVELVFHGPHAPFDESFVEEEIVIDRYAALESARLAKLRQTPWSRDRIIPERLNEYEAQHPQPVAPPPAELAPAAPAPRREVAVDPASDPVLPEYHVSHPATEKQTPKPKVAFSIHAADEAHDAPSHANLVAEDDRASDDRDLIVVEDDAEPQPPGPNRPTGRVRRQEYRQLFARMRRG